MNNEHTGPFHCLQSAIQTAVCLVTGNDVYD